MQSYLWNCKSFSVTTTQHDDDKTKEMVGESYAWLHRAY